MAQVLPRELDEITLEHAAEAATVRVLADALPEDRW